MRCTLPVVFGLLALGACRNEPKKKVPMASATSTASASSVAPTAGPRPMASPASTFALGSLPSGAMLYGRLDVSFFEAAFEVVPVEERDPLLGMIEKSTGSQVGTAAAVPAALGIDPQRPVLFAVVGPLAAPMEALAVDMAKAKSAKERDAVFAKWEALKPSPTMLGRTVLPLTPSAAQGGGAKLLAALNNAGLGTPAPCPQTKECAMLPDAKQLWLGQGQVGVAYVQDDTLVIDGVTAYREKVRAYAIEALAAFKDASGGPASQGGVRTCSQLGAAGKVAVCLVGAPLEQAGVAMGIDQLLRAIGAASLTMDQVAKLTAEGTRTARQVRAIAAKAPTLMDDGTFAVARDAASKKLTVVGSWRVGEAERSKLNAYSERTCAETNAEILDMLDKLASALDVQGGDPRVLQTELREAGWSGLAVVMEGAWPRVPADREGGTKERPFRHRAVRASRSRPHPDQHDVRSDDTRATVSLSARRASSTEGIASSTSYREEVTSFATVRPLTRNDEGNLWKALYLALHVPPGSPPFDPDIVRHPELARYVAGWMDRAGDLGFAAEADDDFIGAAWLRCWTGAGRGFGFVASNVPELTMAVWPAFRGRGVGTELLPATLGAASARYGRVSLSVSLTNPARRLYGRLGFEVVGESEDSVTMVKPLTTSRR